jgi:signal transduction histidine kinase
LSVTNTGPVIPSAEVERLFQPFQRLDPRRVVYKEGHGLGLSIVRAIASAHSASITADPVPEGGLSFRVSFPARTNSGRSLERNEYATKTEFAAT